MRIPINGIELNVVMAGAGSRALLLLHGFTGASIHWQPFIATWGNKYRLVMVDIIGHGQSAAPADPARYAMDLAARDFVQILDHVGVDKAHVLGYSMGARLALTMAVHYPWRVRALVLEGGSPGLKDLQEREARMKRDEALAERIERSGMEAFVHYWETLPLFASQTKLPAAVRAQMRAERLTNREVGLANSLRGMGTGAQPSLWSKLKHVHIPVLLIAGELDHKFCLIAERMQERLPYAELCCVAGAGHTVHVEQAADFGTIVMDFLKRMDFNNIRGWSSDC